MWSGMAMQREEMATGGDPRTRDLLGSCWHWSEGAGLDLETLPLLGESLDVADFNVVLFPQKSSGIGIRGANDGEDGDDACLDRSGRVRFGGGGVGAGRKRKGGGLVQDLNFPQPVWRSRGDDVASRPLAEQNLVAALGSAAAAAEELRVEDRGLRLDLHIPSSHVVGSEWQSVCTLDKVKNALRRAEAESAKRKASDAQRSANGSPSRGSSSPAVRSSDGADGSAATLLATGCPRCLLYVLLPKTDPKCPRCGFLVAAGSAEPNKRPRLFGFDDDRSKPAPSPAASGTRAPDVDHLFDLNTVSF